VGIAARPKPKKRGNIFLDALDLPLLPSNPSAAADTTTLLAGLPAATQAPTEMSTGAGIQRQPSATVKQTVAAPSLSVVSTHTQQQQPPQVLPTMPVVQPTVPAAAAAAHSTNPFLRSLMAPEDAAGGGGSTQYGTPAPQAGSAPRVQPKDEQGASYTQSQTVAPSQQQQASQPPARQKKSVKALYEKLWGDQA
jgi:hypothetical protein